MAAPMPARLQPVDVGDQSTPLLRVIGNNADVADLFRTMTDVLQLVDQLYETNDVDDALWARLAERWNPSELVELVSLSGLYWMASAVANASRGDELAE
jgi:hypothetical protein